VRKRLLLLKMTVGIEDSVALVIFFLFHLRKLPYIFVNSHVPGMHQISPLLGRFHAPLVSGLAHWPGCALQRLLLSPRLSLRRSLFASIGPHYRLEFLAFSSRGCCSRRTVVIFCRCGDPLPFSLVCCSLRRGCRCSLTWHTRHCLLVSDTLYR